MTSCVSGPTAETERTMKQYKRAIYKYQNILDTYMENEFFLDTVAKSKEWKIITNILGSPYEQYPKQFWLDYATSKDI